MARPGGPVRAEAAVLWDAESWWALRAPGLPSSELDHLDAVRQAHRVLYRHGVTADLAHPSDGLSGYRLGSCRASTRSPDDDAANLRRYAEGRRHARRLLPQRRGRPVRAGAHQRPPRSAARPARRRRGGVQAAGGAGDALERGHRDRLERAGAAARRRGRGRLPRRLPRDHPARGAWYVSTRLTDDGYARLLGLPPHRTVLDRAALDRAQMPSAASGCMSRRAASVIDPDNDG